MINEKYSNLNPGWSQSDANNTVGACPQDRLIRSLALEMPRTSNVLPEMPRSLGYLREPKGFRESKEYKVLKVI